MSMLFRQLLSRDLTCDAEHPLRPHMGMVTWPPFLRIWLWQARLGIVLGDCVRLPETAWGCGAAWLFGNTQPAVRLTDVSLPA